MSIMTVNGIISKESLGITTPHEHALIDITNQYPGDTTPGSEGIAGKVSSKYYDRLLADPYALRDNLILDDHRTAIEEVAVFARAGGRSFVDVTLPKIGRDVEFLQRLAKETGLNVIAATGFYTADAHPAEVASMSVEEVAAVMIKELNEGIDGSGVRAGIIGEIGTSQQIHPEELKVLKASAIAHRATGAPVIVHLNPWAKHGAEVIDILEADGVAPEKICLCHMDILLDLEDMRRVLDKGAFLEFDNFGKEFTSGSSYGRFPSDGERMEILYQLISEGYTRQLLLSCDICLKNLLLMHNGPGYGHVLTKIRPMIRQKYGNADEILHTLLVENPARYLDNPRLQ